MKILFIGGTGVISTASTELALKHGIDLYLLNRGTNTANLPQGAQSIVADINQVDDVKAKLAGHQFDCVVNWINYVPAQVQRDIDLFTGKTQQYIFISSASAYQRPLQNYRCTEETPLENPYWQYSRDKIACEKLLNQAHQNDGFPVTIIRPSLTYGDWQIPLALNFWQAPWTVPHRMLQGQRVLVPGDGTTLWTFTHNSDFAKGLIGLIGMDQAIGQAFHITSDEVITWNQAYQTVGKILGVEPKLEHVPSTWLNKFKPGWADGLLGDKSTSYVMDNSKIKQYVSDYQATTNFEQGIAKTIACFQADPSKQIVSDEHSQLLDRVLNVIDIAMDAI